MNNLMSRIEINPNIMLGKPVIKHTRVTVEIILKKLSQNISLDDMLKEYPMLKIQDIKAAIAYASEAISTDERHILVGSKR
ncbi:MAG: antitoxin [Candidatus Firestonebacteria bacterium RIFOXYC2_FULL_39_67]|nr:MAG: antitoxin [Candidatus Firestonebacteria bacterium RIFOXYD2_FULL_39_29]OGF53418.1 MAG: antitoxin [Candidatus Firestonebacteria bacterium RIFOXYC2_FULL_39_67]